jgi:CheY-like chemotaxis protein
MIVITREAEATFLRELEFLSERSSERRCLYIRFSQMGERGADWFSRLTAALEDVADGHVGQVYVCEDKDVFIIMPHLTEKHVQKFKAQYGSALERNGQQLSSLHQVRIDLVFLKSVCERKLEIINTGEDKERERLQKEEEAKAFKASLGDVDSPLVAGLAQRRMQRESMDILIVEDDSLSRMMIKNVLMGDFTVHMATDAAGAIPAYLEAAPDIVFLDIGLPDMSGHELLGGLMRIDPEAYVIMFSGRKDQDNVLRALNAGALGFVGKPFSRGKLYQYIDQCPFVQQKKARKLLPRNKAG